MIFFVMFTTLIRRASSDFKAPRSSLKNTWLRRVFTTPVGGWKSKEVLQLVFELLLTTNLLGPVVSKEAPYSWFSLKHFSYRSESSRDSRVECSRSGEILKNYLQKVCFSVFIDQNVAGSYFRQSCEYEV